MPDASKLTAVDVAILPPPDVSRIAIDLSATLPAAHSKGLRLDDTHLPHITLVQLFVRTEELPQMEADIDGVVRGMTPLRLRVTGGGRSRHTVWMTIERTPELSALHEALMHAVRGIERQGGTAAAFVDGNARPGDVLWVTGYRLSSSFAAFTPHITLGHAKQAPQIEPFEFDAVDVAACHLGRFCSCRRVLRRWSL
jgi:2'-5' RNA ligase